MAKFALQSVLDYRHSVMEAFEIELGRLHAMRLEAQAVLEALLANQQQLYVDLRDRQNAGALDLPLIAQARVNLKAVEKRIAEQMQVIAQLDQQIEAKRQQLIKARQDEETLIKLKEKEQERLTEAEARVEDRQRDDIYIAQAYRHSKGR